MPTLGRHGIRCGLSLSQSSVWTYSAVARVSRSASTTSLRVQRWVENADSGHPSCSAEHETPAVPLGISHLVLGALPGRPFRAENFRARWLKFTGVGVIASGVGVPAAVALGTRQSRWRQWVWR